MKKKLLSVLLSVAMVASLLVGCGNSAAESTGSEAPAEETGTAAEGETAESTEASGDFAGTIKIGGIGPTTGGAAVYGNAVKNAAQIAVDEINTAGGVNGYELELNFQDDECDAEKSVNAYNTLKDWDMQILMGTVTSGCCIAVEDVASQDNMFLLTPSGSAVECITGDNAFRVCFSDPNQGAASAKYIGENGLATKVAVIYDSSDIYSSGIYEKFAAEAANQPFEIVAAEAFTADNKTDFNTQLQKAQESGADLVFLPIYYTEASLILAQADKMGFDVAFFGCDGLDGILQVENFDASLAEGVMLLTPFAADAEDEKTQNFVSAYKAAYGETPNQFAADAYDAIYIIKAACEEAGVTGDMDASAICDALKAVMPTITVDGLTGAGITWTADGEPDKAPKAVKIENGAYVSMD
ncbi:MAG: ABC transporter substrate-binding protein [Lachnospiraceae bacterium]